jgi:hypothetical protein
MTKLEKTLKAIDFWSTVFGTMLWVIIAAVLLSQLPASIGIWALVFVTPFLVGLIQGIVKERSK